MPQNKRKRIGTSSSNPDARENAESYTAAKKKSIVALHTSKSNNHLLVEEKSDKISGSNLVEKKKVMKMKVMKIAQIQVKKGKEDEGDGDKSGGEEKTDESESNRD